MKILVIDSNCLCHQAMHAMEGLSYENLPTGVIFGFMLAIQRLLKKFNTKHFIFVWDSKTSKRKKIFPAYKLQRKVKERTEEEEEIRRLGFPQFDTIQKEVLPTLGFHNIISQKGYEGDDLIASIVYEWDADFTVVTTDNDLYQLLEYCDIWNPRTKKLVTKRSFQRKYGIDPKQWGEVKALAGCSSDGVPGIPGVGEKTAISFLRNELPAKYKKYRAIVSKEGQQIAERNRKLVVLPLEGTAQIGDLCEDEEFRIQSFTDICYDYGLLSLLNKENFLVWRKTLGMV